MATTHRSEALSGTSRGYHTAGSVGAAPPGTAESGTVAVRDGTMRRVRERTKLRVLLNLMVSRTEQRPVVDATMLGPRRAHLPRTSHVRRPLMAVVTSESSGVEELATRVAVFQESPSAGVACERTGAGNMDARTTTSTAAPGQR
ncbi:MAG: hypothetical protein FJW44_05905 [Actinobacteria bacterium]|nr:hypothetical protein [Actinomycetota bacterium]